MVHGGTMSPYAGSGHAVHARSGKSLHENHVSTRKRFPFVIGKKAARRKALTFRRA